MIESKPTNALKNGKTLTLLPSGRSIEVAPGQKIVPLTPELAPSVGIFHWQAMGDNTFRPTARVHEQHMNLPLAEKAFGLDRCTLRRLILAGFVIGRKPSPNLWQVNASSLARHIEAVESDPDFWTDARIKKYAEAL